MRRTTVIAAEVFVDGMTAQNAAQIIRWNDLPALASLRPEAVRVKNYQRMQLPES